MTHSGFVNAVQYDPSGHWLLSASIEGAIQLWDVVEGRAAHSWSPHNGPIHDLACFEDFVISTGHDGRVVCSHLGNGDIRWANQTDSGAHGLAVSQHGVMLGHHNGHVSRWSLKGRQANSFEGHVGAVTALCWLDEGRIASAGWDGSVRVWQPGEGDEGQVSKVWSVNAHQRWSTRLACAGDRLVSTSEDGDACAWSISDGKLLWRTNIGSPIWGLAVNMQKNLCVLGAAGQTLAIDLQTGKIRALPRVPAFSARAISIAPHGRELALGHDAGAIARLATQDFDRLQPLGTAHPGVLVGTCTPSGWVTGHSDGTVRAKNGSARVRANKFMTYCVCQIDEQRVASAGFDGEVIVWSLPHMAAVLRYSHNAHVFSLRPSADGQHLLVAGGDACALVNLASGRAEWTQQNIGAGVHMVSAMSPDATTWALAGEDGWLRWGPFVEANIQSFALPWPDCSAICWIPRTQCVAVGFNNGVVGWLALDTREFHIAHDEHQAWVRMLHASADGRCLLSVSQNGTLRVYDRLSGRLTLTTTEPVACAEFDAGGKPVWLTCEGGSR
ncbi:MAG: WD40 repeat domain-containing protein [Pseudomonadota bacterium]